MRRSPRSPLLAAALLAALASPAAAASPAIVEMRTLSYAPTLVAFPAPGRTVRLVMLAVDGGGCAILLADRMAVGWIAQRLEIGRAHIGRERRRRRAPAAERIVNYKD